MNKFDPKLKLNILIGDVKSTLGAIPDNTVNCCITSPPYYGLRSYLDDDDENKEFEIGNEDTPEEYIQKLVEVFREVRRTLRDDGVCFINIGDSYYNYRPGKGQALNKQTSSKTKQDLPDTCGQRGNKLVGLKEKDLIGIPWMLAFALRADSWYLRQEIIWAKACSGLYSGGTVMPECLSPETMIYIKEGGLIKRRKLSYLFDNKNNIENFLIMTPSGWKKIKNVWKTKKVAHNINVCNVESVIASKDHTFPTVSDIRREKIHDTKTCDLGKKTWMTYKTIDSFLDTNNQSLDMVKVLAGSEEENVFVGCDYNVLKTKFRKTEAFWERFLKKYKYKFTQYQDSIHAPIKDKIIMGLLPAKIIIGEDIDYEKMYLRSSVSKGRVPAKVVLDYDLGRFVGLYATEGGFVDEKRYSMRGAGKFTFHSDESHLVGFVMKMLKKFGVNGRPVPLKSSNSISVCFNSLPLALLLKHLVGGKCKCKNINIDVVLNTAFEFRKGLLEGAVEGDGHVRQSGWIYSSASNVLADNFKTIASSVGVVCGKRDNTQTRKGTVCQSRAIYTQYINRNKLKKGRGVGICARSVVSTGIEIDMIDIEVDGGLFIIGDGLVSHNSVKDRFCRSHEQVFMLTKNSQ